MLFQHLAIELGVGAHGGAFQPCGLDFAGAGDAGKIPAVDSSGRLDTSFMPTGIGADTAAITEGVITFTAGTPFGLVGTSSVYKRESFPGFASPGSEASTLDDVGLALDRVGFTVVDRDRSKGLYFVRYSNPDLDAKKAEKGWLDKLAFWKSDDVKPEQYRVVVTQADPKSVVTVQDPAGAPDKSANSDKILALLKDQLK